MTKDNMIFDKNLASSYETQQHTSSKTVEQHNNEKDHIDRIIEEIMRSPYKETDNENVSFSEEDLRTTESKKKFYIQCCRLYF